MNRSIACRISGGPASECVDVVEVGDSGLWRGSILNEVCVCFGEDARSTRGPKDLLLTVLGAEGAV